MTRSESDDVAAGAPDQAFRELSMILHTPDESLNQVLLRVAELTKQAIPELDEVSVTLLDGRKARSVVFTGSLAVDLDERQYRKGFGPCMDAAISGTTIAVDTGDPSGLYPEFSRVAAGRGVRHSLSVGLPLLQRVSGALNMYSRADHPVPPASVQVAEAFASYAGVALANAGLYHSAVEETGHLREAMRTRAVIEQAKGIVMTTRHCTAEEAFELLVRTSQAQNRKLHEIATDLVDRAGGWRGRTPSEP